MKHTRFDRWPVVALASSLVSLFLAFLFMSTAHAQGTPAPTPLSDWRTLLTPDALLAIAFLMTSPLTALLKHLLGSSDNATVVINVIANALAKGVGLYLTNAATLGFALVSIVLGIITDQAIYRLLVQTSTKGAAKVIDVPASTGATPPNARGGIQ
ncbi:MAG TPA: hypothetical protein VHN99_07950 [Deinococcales bacterium]|nr:hypothetical protein [Deinococcales bacterium]